MKIIIPTIEICLLTVIAALCGCSTNVASPIVEAMGDVSDDTGSEVGDDSDGTDSQTSEERWCPSDDEYEPNDTIHTPNPAIEAPHLLDGIICGENTDNYQIALEDGQWLKVDLYFEHAVSDLNIGLYGPELVSDDQLLRIADSLTDNEELYYDVPASGNYIIQIYSESAEDSPYSLHVTTGFPDTDTQTDTGLDSETDTQTDTGLDSETDSGEDSDTVDTDTGIECIEDLYEGNDSWPAAHPVVFPDNSLTWSVSAMFCPGHPDHWEVYLEAGQTVTVDLLHSIADGDLQLQVWETDPEVTAAAQSITSDDNEHIELPIETTMPYVIFVNYTEPSDIHLPVPYELHVQVTNP